MWRWFGPAHNRSDASNRGCYENPRSVFDAPLGIYSQYFDSRASSAAADASQTRSR
jgi:hypothetical protein